uniref:Uncharacterized protein n=1 Tax=Oryza rufipogon TaxID=4529 RepID=A0A0E0RAK1_ORYRU
MAGPSANLPKPPKPPKTSPKSFWAKPLGKTVGRRVRGPPPSIGRSLAIKIDGFATKLGDRSKAYQRRRPSSEA